VDHSLALACGEGRNDEDRGKQTLSQAGMQARKQVGSCAAANAFQTRVI
jgi:hypothetical protein